MPKAGGGVDVSECKFTKARENPERKGPCLATGPLGATAVRINAPANVSAHRAPRCTRPAALPLPKHGRHPKVSHSLMTPPPPPSPSHVFGFSHPVRLLTHWLPSDKCLTPVSTATDLETHILLRRSTWPKNICIQNVNSYSVRVLGWFFFLHIWHIKYCFI